MFSPYTGFFLSSTDGNMQFAHPDPALRVAPLVEVATFSGREKKLNIDEKHIAFAEKDEKGAPVFFHGLKYFLTTSLPRGALYVFDNHNHALYFWYQEYLHSRKVCKLIHIDQHSDMWENQHSLPIDCLEIDRAREVFQFVQKYCNVGNFIQPALQSGLISDIQLVLTESALQHRIIPSAPYIVDIDLDFFAPEMGIKLETCLPKLRTLIEKAECVTIATSPYFLEQKKAVEMVKKIMLSFV